MHDTYPSASGLGATELGGASLYMYMELPRYGPAGLGLGRTTRASGRGMVRNIWFHVCRFGGLCTTHINDFARRICPRRPRDDQNIY